MGVDDSVEGSIRRADRDRAFRNALEIEVRRARRLFPAPDGLLAALTEEVGEVAKSVLDEPRDRVFEECVQVAAMALRLAVEGDPTLDELRRRRGADE